MTEEEGINFSKLQNEFYRAQQADEKYTRENDAKFRAVHQKVASYEEFRDIVTASHLKPLDKGDVTGAAKANQPWNPLCSGIEKQSSWDQKTIQNDASVTGSNVNNRTEFLKLLNSSDSKINFLSKFDREFLESMFENDIPFNLLENTIESIFKDFPTDIIEIAKIVDILLSFTACKRFQLTLKFLGKSDKEKLRGIVDKIIEQDYNITDIKQHYSVCLPC